MASHCQQCQDRMTFLDTNAGRLLLSNTRGEPLMCARQPEPWNHCCCVLINRKPWLLIHAVAVLCMPCRVPCRVLCCSPSWCLARPSAPPACCGLAWQAASDQQQRQGHWRDCSTASSCECHTDWDGPCQQLCCWGRSAGAVLVPPLQRPAADGQLAILAFCGRDLRGCVCISLGPHATTLQAFHRLQEHNCLNHAVTVQLVFCSVLCCSTT